MILLIPGFSKISGRFYCFKFQSDSINTKYCSKVSKSRFPLNSNLILLIPSKTNSNWKEKHTLNSNLILLIPVRCGQCIRLIYSLNSNLILLIHLLHLIDFDGGTAFKFQSDSINTVEHVARITDFYSPLNSNLILLIRATPKTSNVA